MGESPPRLAPLQGLHILVIDDDEDSLHLLTSLLSRAGAEVTEARSAGEAIDELRKRRPHLIVSDLCLPGEVGGEELLERARELYGDIPAVACTGQVVMMDRSIALAAGFEAQVTKPFEPGELVRAVALVAGRSATGEIN
jgi:CheY-like chemotaxis protein